MPDYEYVDIDPTDYVTGTSIGFETFRALITNPIAMGQGADDAPRISRRAIAPGGAEIDGAFIDGTSAPTGPGFYEYESLVLTAAKTFPFISMLRVAGDSSLANTLTISAVTAANRRTAAAFSAINGEDGITYGNSPGGGAHAGAGGSGTTASGGSAIGLSGTKRSWLNLVPSLGGTGGVSAANSPTAGLGGGCLILIVQGDLDLTGGTITADGTNASEDGVAGAGGGAGGCIIVICTGTLTGGTFNARGGAGDGDSGYRGGGGGGGRVHLIASAFAGTQTINIGGGSGPGSATNGASGFSETETLTEAQINGLLLR